ncbi:VTT domain-containing protein [Henriciella sp. AS95]|uniref:YqaA family protein n=1 Tax=Henriciella sp. AS95 TaxID=3135782 RepID=UPI00316BF3B6
MSETGEKKTPSLRRAVSDWGEGPWALPLATLIGFIENTIIVVPMEPVFLPLMILKRKKAWLIAAALLLGNVLGGIVMYWLGAVFAEEAIRPLVSMLDAESSYSDIMEQLQNDGFATLFMIGVTPFPFQVGVAAAGAAGYPLLYFILAVALSRSIRYFALAALVMAIGQRAEDILEKHELELTILGGLLFVGFVVYFVFF